MVDSRHSAEDLVEEGLQLYSQGELDRAIEKWNEALGLVEDHPRARDYIKYVEDNRAALEASFRQAAAADAEDAPSGGDDAGEPAVGEPPDPDELAAERARRILEQADPRETLPLPGIEPTARMDVSELRDKVDQTKGQRPTPSRTSPALGSSERHRRPTPLVLVPGEGEPADGGFEPLEQTPVGVGLPRPHISDPDRAAAEDEGRSGHFPSVQKTPFVVPPADLFEEDFNAPSPVQPAGSGDERVASMLQGARQLREQGTYEGSLWLCERVLSLDPQNVEARELLEENRRVLLEQHQTSIGDTTGVPVVLIPQHEIMWHKLDHRAGFLLSRIDGQLSYEDIIDVSGMGEFEASRILSQLISLGVIGAKR